MPYELYEQRGREDGHETEDWLEAEAELAAERHTPLSVAAVKAARKPPVISTGKSKANGLKSRDRRRGLLRWQNNTEETVRNGN